MATLHIEHGISDFTTWKQAFDGFAERRAQAGVTAQRIHQPADDRCYIVLQLDFSTAEQAERFKQFLETRIWTTPESSPALSGTPRARVLVDAPV